MGLTVGVEDATKHTIVVYFVIYYKQQKEQLRIIPTTQSYKTKTMLKIYLLKMILFQDNLSFQDEFLLIKMLTNKYNLTLKFMKCISSNTAQYLCINRNCEVENPYICADTSDACKQSHQCCSLISLSYLLKKTKNETPSSNPQNSSKKDLLYPLYDKAKAIANTISLALASEKIIKQIHKLLDAGNPLSPEDKDKIAKFMNDRKLDNSTQDGLMFKIQKQIEDFQVLASDFYQSMKALRDRQIVELKKKLYDDDRMKIGSQIQLKASRINEAKISKAIESKTFKKEKPIKRKHKEQVITEEETERGKQQGKKFEEDDFGVKKVGSQMRINNFEKLQKIEKGDKNSKKGKQSSVKKSKKYFKEEEEIEVVSEKMPTIIGPSPTKSRIPEILKSGIKAKGSRVQDKQSSLLKNHVPREPLFSKITNDIRTIKSFFSSKIESAQLLYRASQNEFSTNKFHEKCDGHKNTLTLIITEFDKVIGGFTTLPWKTGGGQWYEDEDEVSFLFSLTLGERYPLVNRERAIWCSRNFGPSFGNPDLQICEKANTNSNSCANFPKCYNNGNYTNTPGSVQLFCGTKNGHFKILEWEVYELTFS